MGSFTFGLLALVLTACGDTAGTSLAPRPPDTPAPLYDVVFEVTYLESLRVPGSGYLLREIDVSYHFEASAADGELARGSAAGHSKWAVRCYENQFTPGLSPVSEFVGDHPANFGPSLDQLPAAIGREPTVDWTAGPATVVLSTGNEIWVGHRLPASIGLDQEIGCSESNRYSALSLVLGDAQMRAPGWVVSDRGSFSRAEARNLDAAGAPVYLLDQAGTGWLVGTFSATALAESEQPISFVYDEGAQPEGGQELSITGTVRLVTP